jgi:DHA1 family inner membrane transport protein
MKSDGAPPIMQRRMIMPTLFMAVLSFQVPPAVLSFFLVDIAATFETPVGVAGQLGTAGFLVTILTAALVGVAASRWTYKTLLLVCMGCLGISGVGASLAPSFAILLVMYALSGITTGMSMSLSMALIGRYYPVSERPKRSSYASIGYVVPGIVLPPLFSVMGDWRLAFLLVAVVACTSAVMLWRGLPAEKAPSGRPLAGYRDVLSNRSALGLLLANIFATAGFIVFVVFALSLFREKFGLSTDLTSLIATGMSLAYLIGILVAGRIVHRYGRKWLTVVFCLVIGLAIIGLTVIPVWGIAVLSYYVGTFSGGIRGLAMMNLALEQEPKHQAVMQAMTTVSQYIASTVGTTLGGLILIWHNYDWLAILGLFTVIGGVLFQVTTIDPTKQVEPPEA